MGILLYEVKTYIKLSLEAMEIFIAKIRSELSEVGGRYKSNNLCPSKEKDFLLSKTLRLQFCILIQVRKFFKKIQLWAGQSMLATIGF